MKDAASFLHCSTVHFVTVGATVGKTRPDLARLSALTFPAMPMWPGIHSKNYLAHAISLRKNTSWQGGQVFRYCLLF